MASMIDMMDVYGLSNNSLWLYAKEDKGDTILPVYFIVDVICIIQLQKWVNVCMCSEGLKRPGSSLAVRILKQACTNVKNFVTKVLKYETSLNWNIKFECTAVSLSNGSLCVWCYCECHKLIF